MRLSGNVWCYSIYKSNFLWFLSKKTVQMQTTFNSSHIPMQPMAVGSGCTIQSIQPNEGLQPAQVVAPIPVPNMSSSSSGLQKWGGGRFLQWNEY